MSLFKRKSYVTELSPKSFRDVEGIAKSGGISTDIVAQIVAQYMSDHPVADILTASDVTDIVTNYITAHPTKVPTESEINSLISDYVSAHPDKVRTDSEINALITSYMNAHPVSTLSESDVNSIISAYMAEHPSESISQEQIEQIVDTYVEGLDITSGKDGKDGENGKDGKSAYEIAVEHGFTGTEEEWIASLKGNGTLKTALSSTTIQALKNIFENVVFVSDNGEDLIQQFLDSLTVEIVLPEGYTKVSCVVVDGKSAIPTDITEADYYGGESTIKLRKEDLRKLTSASGRVIHIMTTNNMYMPTFKNGSTGKQVMFKAGKATPDSKAGIDIQPDALYTIRHNMIATDINVYEHHIYLNDTELFSTEPTLLNRDVNSKFDLLSFTSNHTIVSEGGSTYSSRYSFSAKLYDLKLFNKDGSLFAHFIPCYNSENQVGLYDVVRDKFYTDANLTFEN